MHLPAYLTLLSSAGQTQANSYRQVAVGHAGEPDVRYICEDFARQCAAHAEALAPIVVRYADRRQDEPDRLHPAGLTSPRSGPAGLLRDLQDLYQLASLVEITWILVGQAAAGARDRDLLQVADRCAAQITAQLAWLRTHMKAVAPQTLLVAP